MMSRTEATIGKPFYRTDFFVEHRENIMPEENTTEAQQEEKTMPSVRKQIAFMAIVVVGITIVLGGGVLLSMWLK
jgi:hypothetical protein